MGKQFLELASINGNIKDKELEPYKEANNTAMFKGGAMYADVITFGADKIDKKLVESFAKAKGKKILPYNKESDLTEYLELYNELAPK
jgi:starch synthase